MANWMYRLDIKDEYKEAEAGTLKPHEMAHRIAEKIKALSVYDFELREIVDSFKAIVEGDTFDDTDDVMAMLYDWGDTWHNGNTKTCWVATF